jgi:hypothetical protein
MLAVKRIGQKGKIRKNVGGVLLFNNDQCINPIGRVKRFYSVIKNELESS